MNNINAVMTILSVCSSVIAILIYYKLLRIVCCVKEKYVEVKQYISFNDVVKINFQTLTKIILNYDKWFIRLVDKDRNECDIHFYKNRRCRRIMIKMGKTIIECHKAYMNKDKIPYVSDEIYKGNIFNNKAFIVVNKSKACITENIEVR